LPNIASVNFAIWVLSTYILNQS